MEKPAGAPVGPEADDEHRLFVAEREQLVHRHREAALRLRRRARRRRSPRSSARSRPSISPGRRTRAGSPPSRAGAPTAAPCGSRDPRARTPRRLDDRLVPVVERVQPVRAVQREPPLRRAEDRDPPVAAWAKRDERMRPARRARASGPIGSPETIATHADDAVGEERRSSSPKKYDLSARSTNGASVSTPQRGRRARRRAAARAPPGAPGAATARANRRRSTRSRRRRAGTARAGTSSPNAPTRCGEPRMFSPTRPAGDLAQREARA